MDRNSIFGFVLIAAILGIYTWYTMPNAEQRAAMATEQRIQDSLANVAIEKEAREKETQLKEAGTTMVDTASQGLAVVDTVHADSLREVAMRQRYGIFTAAAQGEGGTVQLENEKLQVSINTHGARPAVIRLKEYRSYEKTPLFLSDPDSGTYEFDLFLGNQKISTKDLYFSAEKRGTDGVVLTAPSVDPTKFVRITYQLDSSGFFMDMKTELVGLRDEVDPGTMVFQWDLVGYSNEKYRDGELQKSTIYYKYFNDDFESLSTTGEDEKKLEGRTNWIAFKQDFFSVAMVSNEGFANGSELAVVPTTDSVHTKRYNAQLFFEKERAEHVAIPMRFYLGPNHYGTLRRTEI
ncbi:MAG: YidC/Oxa1 family insertase periplasmic-domain containing protein, partial [Flavobacteriales bacterium]|nr:YidC/Oxa1 family insertase periplasmic-domain containing protein [Flavobacteriales bacterium]